MLNVTRYKIGTADEKFFLYLANNWQRRYEALIAYFVDRLPAKAVADRYGYSPAYVVTVKVPRKSVLNKELRFCAG